MFSMNIFKKIKSVIRQGGWRFLFQKIKRRLHWNYKDFFAHQMPRGMPQVQVTIKDAKVESNDSTIAERIRKAFLIATSDEHAQMPQGKFSEDAWDDNRNRYHAEAYKVLRHGSSLELARYLANMHRRGITYGISGSSTEYRQMSRNTRLRNQKGAIVKDIITSLAEALGILPFEAIVPYTPKKNIYADVNVLIKDIETKIGIQITPPEIEGGLFKLKTEKGSLDERDLWSLYAALRIAKIADQIELPTCEIGAGIGKVAFYASRLGFKDYDIFDLPVINVIQAWHLMHALPDRKFTLYGESEQPEAIRIMPYWVFGDTEKQYNTVLNQDSFPEIGKDIVKDYLQKINKHSRFFLSINQEHQAPLFPGAADCNLLVPQIVEAVGGLERIYRFPFWLRKDYVEELYRIEK